MRLWKLCTSQTVAEGNLRADKSSFETLESNAESTGAPVGLIQETIFDRSQNLVRLMLSYFFLCIQASFLFSCSSQCLTQITSLPVER